MRDLVIIGAGGFGRETIDVVRSANAESPTWDVVGIIDSAPSEINLARLTALGIRHLGDLASIPQGVDVAVAIGNPSTRARIVADLSGGSHSFPALIHPSATIGSEFSHGEGLIVLAGVSIGTNVSLGDHVHLNGHAILGHDARCEDFVSINPNATLSGDTTVASRTLIGATATVLQGLSIGTGCTVGAGSVVTVDVPPLATVMGVPARLQPTGPTRRNNAHETEPS